MLKPAESKSLREKYNKLQLGLIHGRPRILRTKMAIFSGIPYVKN